MSTSIQTHRTRFSDNKSNMGRKPYWWQLLEHAKSEALFAVDAYNRSSESRNFHAFVVHMCIAWTKLLIAEFEKNGFNPLVHTNRTDKRPKRRVSDSYKPLGVLADQKFEAKDPVLHNLKLFIEARDHITHRYEEDYATLLAGHAQALLLNFENFLVREFGINESLSGKLRFPLFVTSLTDGGVAALKQLRQRMPGTELGWLQKFDLSLDPEVRDSLVFEYRVVLIPNASPKSRADVALTVVKSEDLNPDKRDALAQAMLIIREVEVPAAEKYVHRASDVVNLVAAEVKPTRFNQTDHTDAWKRHKVRPPSRDSHPNNTDPKHCKYQPAYKSYLYTDAWVKLLVSELSVATGAAPQQIAKSTP